MSKIFWYAYDPVRGVGPPSWLFTKLGAESVTLVTGGRAFVGARKGGGELRGVAAVWDGGSVRVAFRDDHARTRLATIDSKGEIVDAGELPRGRPLPAPLIDEVTLAVDHRAFVRTRRIGLDVGEPIPVETVDRMASVELPYEPRISWTGERFLVGYWVQAADDRWATRYVAIDCRP